MGHDSSNWVEHRFDWTPEYIKFYVDGNLVRTSTTSDEGVRKMNKSQPLYMNFWTPDWSPWGDNRNDKTMPWYVDYDFVEVHKYNANTKDFDLYWRDDFSSLDLNRWAISSKSAFGGSLSYFSKEQAYIY